ncbi:hypothetical protein GIB67_033870 [Kingdonia uniflora]|uniref:BRISC and BRCA1-A complex member 2 n=1 Tax=Kingdonia uniflora TaxID=39325 RepID=A0A7J7MJ11_9MAGN|nr:hypothetical protein GIB67_033870 [Kingdonia uniflora]
MFCVSLNSSVARGGEIRCAIRHKLKQTGAWVPMETSPEDLLAGLVEGVDSLHPIPLKNTATLVCLQLHALLIEVVFPVSKKYSSVPSVPRIKLVSSSELKALFPIEDVKLPPWLNGMCLAEYLPTVEDHLKMQIVDSVASIGARRRFIEALALLFGRPVEADPVFCRKVTFLGASGAFTFLLSQQYYASGEREWPTASEGLCC